MDTYSYIHPFEQLTFIVYGSFHLYHPVFVYQRVYFGYTAVSRDIGQGKRSYLYTIACFDKRQFAFQNCESGFQCAGIDNGTENIGGRSRIELFGEQVSDDTVESGGQDCVSLLVFGKLPRDQCLVIPAFYLD